MVILRSQNKITDFFLILVWASPSNMVLYVSVFCDDCLYFSFDNHLNDDSCFGAISEEFGDVYLTNNSVSGNAAVFDGQSRLLVSLFKNWLEVSLSVIRFLMLLAFTTYRIKPEELSILSCERGPRPEAEAFFTAKNGEPQGF